MTALINFQIKDKQPLPPETATGTSISSNNDHALVALSNMVSNPLQDEYQPTNTSPTVGNASSHKSHNYQTTQE